MTEEQQKQEINILKLQNGEEIIGKTQFLEEGGIVLVEDAVQIFAGPTEDNRMNLLMFPYLSYTKTFIVYQRAIVAVAVPNDDLLERYTRINSKIVVPKSNIVTS
jgi:hypothetical protein